MKGKLVVLEGVDASGKTTQYELLKSRLAADGVAVCPITFPCYESPSSAPVRMYLDGQFGTRPEDVNAYAASALYAVDRFASYKTDWGKAYEEGGFILAARYTTSNAVHQAAKLPEGEREAYLSWLYEFEFEKMGLPKPDLVLFLDVPPEISLKLLAARRDVTGQRDIHEEDPGYLTRCYTAAVTAAEHYGWARIHCTEGEELRSVEDISDELYARIRALLDPR
ncbi:MAG: thymidylate kinase [Clostridia bacterium]|nr:thymidylate kinase [Clostridia bacterium]